VISVPVQFAAGLAADPLVNTASASANGGAAVTASDSDARASASGLAIAKSDGSAIYTPGGTATYVLTVTNAGPSNASNVTVDDVLPGGVTLATTATCTATGSASCGVVTGLAGAGAVAVTGAAIAAGPGNSLSISVPVRFAASLRTDPLVNTASAGASGGAAATASDSDALAGAASIAVTVTDNASHYVPGGTGIYVIRVTNTGLSDATGVGVVDNLPAGVTLAARVTCTAEGSASCGTIASAAGGSTMTLSGATIPAGAGNAIVITVRVRFAPSLTAGTLVNAVSASVSGGASAVGMDTDVRTAPPAARAIPVDRPIALLILVAAIALLRMTHRPDRPRQ
jgi:uncharacterized repeat protein (TIGR01451 family)